MQWEIGIYFPFKVVDKLKELSYSPKVGHDGDENENFEGRSDMDQGSLIYYVQIVGETEGRNGDD